MQWQLYSQEDVAGFQSEIQSHVAALSVVMTSSAQYVCNDWHYVYPC